MYLVDASLQVVYYSSIIENDTFFQRGLSLSTV